MKLQGKGRMACRSLLVAACCGLAILASVAAINDDIRSALEAEHLAAKADPRNSFASWVERMGKAYKDDVEEFEKRFDIWLSNLEYILDYNSKVDSHWLALNSMADKSEEEYRKLLGTRVPEERKQLNENPYHKEVGLVRVPQAVDWRKRGIVSPVKDQRSCGGCWAFSATGSIEGANALYTGELVVLSEQELIDCELTDDGCEGGWMDDAFEFVVQHGLDTENDYMFVGHDESCDLDKERREIVTIDSYKDVKQGEDNLLPVAAVQPISVAIDAASASFMLYSGGIYDAPCGTDLDHGVLLVGYDLTDQYWIIKNSWGESWGEDGYIRFKMGLNNGTGQCGVGVAASYPIKKSPNPPPPQPGPGPSPKPSPTPAPPAPPVMCNSYFSCPAGSTCCCEFEIMNYCLMYGCCPYKDATCCEDKKHCCPSEHICRSSDGMCMDKTGVKVPWETKMHASLQLTGTTEVAKSDSERTPRSVGKFSAT